jgi:hypothetical protein
MGRRVLSANKAWHSHGWMGLTVSAPSGDTPASIVTTTAGSFLEFTDGNTTAGRSPLVGAITDDLAFYTSAGSYSAVALHRLAPLTYCRLKRRLN